MNIYSDIAKPDILGELSQDIYVKILKHVPKHGFPLIDIEEDMRNTVSHNTQNIRMALAGFLNDMNNSKYIPLIHESIF